MFCWSPNDRFGIGSIIMSHQGVSIGVLVQMQIAPLRRRCLHICGHRSLLREGLDGSLSNFLQGLLHLAVESAQRTAPSRCLAAQGATLASGSSRVLAAWLQCGDDGASRGQRSGPPRSLMVWSSCSCSGWPAWAGASAPSGSPQPGRCRINMSARLASLQRQKGWPTPVAPAPPTLSQISGDAAAAKGLTVVATATLEASPARSS